MPGQLSTGSSSDSRVPSSRFQLFATSGYGTPRSTISQAAGYSKGAYYFHFSTKEDILLELLRVWTEGRSLVLAQGAESGASPREALHQTLANFVSYSDAPQWPGVLLEFWAQALRNAELSKRLTQSYASWRKQIGEIFTVAAEAGALTLASAEDAAAVALAAHDGYAVQIAIGSPGGKAMTPAELTDRLLAPLETAAPRSLDRPPPANPSASILA
jgi:AcrR family transcriptional regulator